MYYTIDWHIEIGDYQLALLASCEIHKSVDVLADTCTIELPAMSYNAALRIENKLKRGDAVVVKLGYNGNLQTEFTGYMLYASTDDGKISIKCEDEIFLFRMAVADKQFVSKSVEEIAKYLIEQTGVSLGINCTLTLMYDKFVISSATAFDVLNKIQEETKANIYVQDGKLQIHPPFIEKAGEVDYSFQQNIEASSLKYLTKENKRIQIVVSTTGKDGKKKEVRYGTTGGEQVNISGSGMSEDAMKQIAKNEYSRRWFDGYEGDITGWLIPFVQPSYTASINDEDYEYKDGRYYVTAVTTTIDENGGVRKIHLGVKVG